MTIYTYKICSNICTVILRSSTFIPELSSMLMHQRFCIIRSDFLNMGNKACVYWTKEAREVHIYISWVCDIKVFTRGSFTRCIINPSFRTMMSGSFIKRGNNCFYREASTGIITNYKVVSVIYRCECVEYRVFRMYNTVYTFHDNLSLLVA